LRGTDLPADDIVIGIVPSSEDEPVPSEAAPEPEEQ